MSAAHSVVVTFFRDAKAKTKHQKQLTLAELGEMIRTTTAGDKTMLPWLKFARFGNATSTHGSLRWDRNVIAITGVEGDYDGEKVPFAAAVEAIEKAGLEALVYTSPSYTPDKPRWRVACTTSREYPPERRAQFVSRINGLLGGILGAESWVLSQSYYYGAVNNNPDHQVEVIDGEPIDELDELDAIAIAKPGTKAGTGNGLDRSYQSTGPIDQAALLEEIRTGAAYHEPAMRLLGHWALHGVAMLEAKARLSAAFDCVPPSGRDQRWQDRVKSIPDMLAYIWPKEGEKRDKQADDPDGTIIDKAAPFTTAKLYLSTHFVYSDAPTLHHHRGTFYSWNGAAYCELGEAALRAGLYNFLDRCVVVDSKGNSRWVKPNAALIANILDGLRAAAHLSDEISAPAWLDHVPDAEAEDIISCANGLLHLPTLSLLPHTPRFFTTNAVDIAFDRTVGVPAQWLRFLADLWPDDAQSIDTLQEIFGYCLTADTAQQKAFLIIGPKRSGKGTIARVLTRVVGIENAVAPTLAGLGTHFGVAPLIGKRVAIISDARLGARPDQHAIAERLLSITGEDINTVDRKFREAWTGRLQTRFVILSNELPRLTDASGALVSRFIVMVLTVSFYGREDHALTNRLLAELPAILNWSITGLNRLRDRGYFVQPNSAAEAVQDLEDLGSPIGAFLRERCVVAPGRAVEVGRLFEVWLEWGKQQGRDHLGNAQTFGRDLRAAVPGLKASRPRDDDGERRRLYLGLGLR